jgi:transcriptional regulator with XRE-family HTH domain
MQKCQGDFLDMQNASSGQRIQLFREHLKLSRKDFTAEIGVSQATVSRIEAGLLKPSDVFINAMMGRFAANPDWIKTGEGNMFIAPEEYIANGIKLLGAQRFSEGLAKVLKDPRFEELQVLVAVGEMLQGSLDREIEKYLKYIVDTWQQGDEKMKNWLMVQLEKAFGEVND